MLLFSRDKKGCRFLKRRSIGKRTNLLKLVSPCDEMYTKPTSELGRPFSQKCRPTHPLLIFLVLDRLSPSTKRDISLKRTHDPLSFLIFLSCLLDKLFLTC